MFREGNENTVTAAFSVVIKHGVCINCDCYFMSYPQSQGANTISWISPELMAIAAAVLLWYAAYNKKCRIQSNS